MHERNVRARERFEVSLDGRQIASIVVGALVIVCVVFLLGLSVGKHLAAARAEAERTGDLEALDLVSGSPATPVPAKDELTFFRELPRAKPSQPAPAEPRPAAVPAPAPPPPPPAAAPPDPVADAPRSAEAAPAAAADREGEGASPEAPARAVAGERPPARVAKGGWAIQVAAARERADAERVAQRLRRFSPRIEVADVPGKGRYHRVRVGSFESREAAERYLRDLEREAGVEGFVTSVP
jgi:cell division septation protein DedD